MGRASACLSFGFFVWQCLAALGDEAVSTAPSPASKLGQLFLRNPRADAFERLPVARLQMHVELRPPLALVRIDQTFFSPFADEREGTFAIDLPEGAAVSRFAMSAVAGRLVEAELAGKPRAEQIHTTVTRGRQAVKAPEQTGDNLFQMRVFPIAGRGVKRVLLDYTLPLAAAGSRYHFRLPLNRDGALPGERSGEHSGEDGPHGPSPATGTAWEGHPPQEPILEFQLTGEIHPFVGQIAAADVTSTSHPDLACQTRADGSLAFSITRRQYQPPAEFAVSFPVARQRPPVAVRSYRARGRTGNAADADTYYFLAQINRRGRMAATAPADVLILANTSSGITEPDTVRQVAAAIIKNLRGEDRFQLGCIDVAYRPLTTSWTKPGSPDAAEACAAIDRQLFLGETDLIGCFRQALEQAFATNEGRRRVVIYIGDGYNTVPGTAAQAAFADVLDEQLKNAGASPVVYLVPAILSPDSPRFMEKLTHPEAAAGAYYGAMYGIMHLAVSLSHLTPITSASGGIVFDGRHPARASAALHQWLSSGLPTRPRLNKVEVEGARPEELYYLPDMLGDGSLQVLGRTTRGGRAKLTLSLAEGLEQSVEEYEIEIDPRDENVLLGRLWAQHRVDELAANSPQEKSPELAKIVELSQEWSLLSPYMALLLLEIESDYARWGIDPRLRRRYWQAAEAPPPFAPPAGWLRPPEESPADKQAAAERFAKLLAPARESLDRSDYEAAWAQLESLRRLLPAEASTEFAELAKRAQSGLRRVTLFERLGARRRLIDPLANPVSLHRSFEPGRLLWASCSPEFLRTQPHADRWLEELTVPADSWTLGKWARLLGDRSGVSVVLDRKSLSEVGIDEDTRLQVVGQGRLSLRSLLQHAFRSTDLAVIDEPNCFVITSRATAESRLTTHVYPVADLLTPGESADLGLLADPYLDREDAARRRISARLAQPISLSYTETPLREVIEQFATRLKAAVVIDVEAVREVRHDLTTPLTGAFSDAPLGESLRWALDELDLTFTLRDEALLITSKTEAENMLRVDLHSGRDLLREYLTPVGPDGRPLGRKYGMGMGGGGMFSIDSEVAWPVGLGFAPEKRYNLPAIQAAIQTARSSQPFATRRLLGNEPTITPTAVFAPDELAVIDLVTSTIEPTSWDEVGGPGTVRFFEPTLDFVIAATDDVHAQIERLFASLRKLPPVESRSTSDGQRPRISRPAAMPSGGQRLLPPDEQPFIDLITSSVAPTTWDEVGGPGAIRADLPHLALVISQTQETHAEITRLFTLLRRSRYAATHGDRPWEAEFLSGAPFGGLGMSGSGRIENPGGWPSQAVPPISFARDGLGRPSSERAAADPASLAVLAAVRREPREGIWRWAYSRPTAAAETIELRRQADRMELVFGEQSVRIDGADAAVLYPGLALVEIGPWAAAAHALADGRLPWLAHRTNEELARIFMVEALPVTDADKQAGQTRIRLRFIGLEDSEQTHIEAAFSHEHRLPTAWAAFVDGELTLRLQFKDLIDYDGRKEWRQTILQDADGVEIAGWRLTAAADKDADKLAAPAGEISDGAFAGLMVVDRRPLRAAPDADFAAALEALRKSDWSGADRRLVNALSSRARFADKEDGLPRPSTSKVTGQEAHPPQTSHGHRIVTSEQPLLLFLRAWCHARDPVRASDAQARDWLAEVAGGSAVTLTRAITERQFPFLSVEERYDLLARQPAELRTPLDEQHLARAAQAAGRFEAALVHVDATRRGLVNGDATEPFELARLRVEILLRLDRKDEAADAALRWAVARSGIRKNSGRAPLPPPDNARIPGARLGEDGPPGPSPRNGTAWEGHPPYRPVAYDRLIDLAELLRRSALNDAADRLLALALDRPGVTAAERYDLLLRRANCHHGLKRWQWMVRAIDPPDLDARLREAGLAVLLEELSDEEHADAAAQLAGQCQSEALRTRLLVRQAELTPKLPGVELCWRLAQAHRLPADRLSWAAARFNQAEQPERTVEMLEGELRAGRFVPPVALRQLELAYLQLNRPADARRASTADPGGNLGMGAP